MRKWLLLALAMVCSGLGGIAQSARGAVTVDVVFQDGTGSQLTILAGQEGSGCAFNGYYGGSVATGYCMDVMLRTTIPIYAFAASVQYDGDNGLAVGSAYEWKGVGVSFDKQGQTLARCAPDPGVVDDEGILRTFDCVVGVNPVPPDVPPQLEPGTYRLGTIVWDASGTHCAVEECEDTIAAVIAGGDGAFGYINGNILLYTDSIVLNSALLTIIPEPGTAALLGLGLLGVVVSARRRRARR